jgi:hypothetical protein
MTFTDGLWFFGILFFPLIFLMLGILLIGESGEEPADRELFPGLIVLAYRAIRRKRGQS